MIYHLVRMSFKPEVSASEIEAGLERLRRMGREIDVVQSWCVGRDFGGDFEYGAVYVLPDIQAYEIYMNAPVHLETDAAGLPLVADFVSLDLTDDRTRRSARRSARSTAPGTRTTPRCSGSSRASTPTPGAVCRTTARHRSSDHVEDAARC